MRNAKGSGMVKNKPILSVCVPTYNRAQYLKKSLLSLVAQLGTCSDEVEVVICDNCSTDDTNQVCADYCSKYNYIKYYRNSENIRDRNFPTVIGLASGQYRKLFNDTAIYHSDAISSLISVIKNNSIRKPTLFFSNKKKDKKSLVEVVGINQFLEKVSFLCTWIGAFGIWEEDFSTLEDKYEACDLSLWQTANLLHQVANKEQVLVCETKLFDIQSIEKKNIGYGLFQVFYTNYFNIITNYSVSEKTLYYLKKDVLMNFFLAWLVESRFNSEKYITSHVEDFRSCVFSTYKRESYFFFFRFILGLREIKLLLIKRIKRFISY